MLLSALICAAFGQTFTREVVCVHQTASFQPAYVAVYGVGSTMYFGCEIWDGRGGVFAPDGPPTVHYNRYDAGLLFGSSTTPATVTSDISLDEASYGFSLAVPGDKSVVYFLALQEGDSPDCDEGEYDLRELEVDPADGSVDRSLVVDGEHDDLNSGNADCPKEGRSWIEVDEANDEIHATWTCNEREPAGNVDDVYGDVRALDTTSSWSGTPPSAIDGSGVQDHSALHVRPGSDGDRVVCLHNATLTGEIGVVLQDEATSTIVTLTPNASGSGNFPHCTSSDSAVGLAWVESDEIHARFCRGGSADDFANCDTIGEWGGAGRVSEANHDGSSPFVAVDDHDNFYVVYEDLFSSTRRVKIAFSCNGGASCSAAPGVTSPISVEAFNTPQLIGRGPTSARAIWVENDAGGGDELGVVYVRKPASGNQEGVWAHVDTESICDCP